MSPRSKDLLERAAWSAGQQFMAVLVATGTAASVVELPWELAVWSALIAGAVSVLTTFIVYLSSTLGRWIADKFWVDLVTRAAKTFVASVAGSLAGLAIADLGDWDWRGAMSIAAVATIQTVAKAVLSREPASNQPGAPPPTASSLSQDTYREACGL